MKTRKTKKYYMLILTFILLFLIPSCSSLNTTKPLKTTETTEDEDQINVMIKQECFDFADACSFPVDEYWSDENSWARIIDGEYVLYEAKENCKFYHLTGEYKEDIWIEVDAEELTKSHFYYGIAFGPRNNYYRYSISSDGHFNLSKFSNGIETKLTKWIKIKNHSKKNHLKLECSGKKIVLYLNNQKLANFGDKNYNGGNLALYIGSWDKKEAKIAFDNFLAVSPPINEKTKKYFKPMNYFDLGVYYGKCGMENEQNFYYEKAISGFKRVILFKNNYNEIYIAHFQLGRIYYNRNVYDKAINEYKKALFIYPEDWATWYNIALSYKHSGDINNAISALELAIRNCDVLELRYRARNFLNEIKAEKLAKEKERKDAAAREDIKIAMKLKRKRNNLVEKCIDIISKDIKKHVSKSNSRIILSDIYRDAPNNFEDIFKTVRNRVIQDQYSQLNWSVKISQKEIKDYYHSNWANQKRIQLKKKLLKQIRGDKVIFEENEKKLNIFLNEKIKKAKEQFQAKTLAKKKKSKKSSKKDENKIVKSSEEILYDSAIEDINNGKFLNAVSRLNNLLKNNPNNEKAREAKLQSYYKLTLRCYRKKKINDGSRYMKKILEFDPYYKTIGKEKIAKLYFERGVIKIKKYRKEAMEDFKESKGLDPKLTKFANNKISEIISLEGMDSFNEGRILEAEEMFKRAEKYDPSCAVLNFIRGKIHLKNREYDKAQKFLQKAVDTKPNEPRYLYYLGQSYDLPKKDVKQALDCYNKAIKLDPQFSEIHFYRGMIYHLLRKYKLAKKDFERCIEITNNKKLKMRAEQFLKQIK